MSSHVFYRFKSQKEPSRISFDGTGISVWDLKKEIIMENKMGKGGDFDFAIYNEDTEEAYNDDRAIVPRSTSVLAQRLPPSKPGRGNAQNYMAQPVGAETMGRYANQGDRGGGGGGGGWRQGGGSMSRRFDGKEDGGGDMRPSVQEPVQVMLPAAAPADEANALAAMFAATSDAWQRTQEQMASATPIHRARMPVTRAPLPPRDFSSSTAGPSTSTAGAGGPSAPRPQESSYQAQQPSMSHKAPPTGYICYRCGQKGHWIQDCPTNADRAWDDRPRIKRTTGIPKSFLTTVEGPGTDNTAAGMMVTAEGGFVIAKPDNASWELHRAITKNLTANDIQNLAPRDPDLTCPVCSRLLRDAVLSPCCSTSFCEDCVHNALADNDMLCPECESRIKNLDKLVVDTGRRERAKAYIAEMVEASKEVVEPEEEVKEEEKPDVDVKEEDGVKAEEADVSLIKSESPDVKPILLPDSPSKDSSNAEASTVDPTSTDTPHDPSTIPSAPTTRPPPPALNAQQQAQVLRQQQLQQQRALAMQNGYGPMGMGMGMNPQMVQQQMYQIQMTLQNPQLHPQMRMNLMGQMQQMQMMAVQMGLMAAPGGPGRRVGGPLAGAYGGNFAMGRGRGGQQQQYQQQQSVPTGPRGGPDGQDARGGKRARPSDFNDQSPGRRRGEDSEVPSGPPLE